MININPFDYYNIDALLSNEERIIRDSVKEFVAGEILPTIEKHYEAGSNIPDLAQKMAEMGLFGITIPEEYGGAGANYVAYGLAMQELEYGDSAVRSFASVQNSLVMYPIYSYGTKMQKKEWLPKLANGTAIGCFGLTEPDYGSNPGGMLTTATRTDSGYLLNGAKMWITNGTVADIAIVWAKLDGVISGFLVEKGTKGFSAPEMKGKHSLRASVTSELIFEDCEIPLENKLDISGIKGPLNCLTQARYGIAWGAVGSAIAVFESALNYSKSRIQFGKPIAGFQLTQDKLVRILNEITKAQLVNYRLGRMKDDGIADFRHVSFAKRNNVEMALNSARIAREILGANGISNEYCIMRHANNLESVKTYEGTHEIHTLILGEDITGVQAYY